jgi:uncharacterized membrane protein YfcA
MQLMTTPESLGLLFLAALLAGFIDTLAGGGGLITIPALLLAQIPPAFVLGTNKLQGAAGSFVATLMMLRKRIVSIKTIGAGMLASAVGAALGAWVVLQIDVKHLTIIIPFLLVFIAVYFLFSPQSHMDQRPAKISNKIYHATWAPSIGFYDGFLGPATGSFFCVTGILFRGYDIIKATAEAKPLNFASNIGALVVFLMGGKVLWMIGGIMIMGQVIGAWAASHVMVKIGRKIIRPLIVIVCIAMLGRYFLSL